MVDVVSFENSEAVSATGTSLVGTIKTTYSDLVETFGEPTYQMAGDKVNTEWKLEFQVWNWKNADTDYHVVTIYDWKLDETPFGEYDWHIGGNTFEAIEMVENAMRGAVIGFLKENAMRARQ